MGTFYILFNNSTHITDVDEVEISVLINDNMFIFFTYSTESCR